MRDDIVRVPPGAAPAGERDLRPIDEAEAVEVVDTALEVGHLVLAFARRPHDRARGERRWREEHDEPGVGEHLNRRTAVLLHAIDDEGVVFGIIALIFDLNDERIATPALVADRFDEIAERRERVVLAAPANAAHLTERLVA